MSENTLPCGPHLCGAESFYVVQADYIPLHWGALNGMDKMVRFHLRETDVDIADTVGLGEPHVCALTTCDTYSAQYVVLKAAVPRYYNTTNDCMQPSCC